MESPGNMWLNLLFFSSTLQVQKIKPTCSRSVLTFRQNNFQVIKKLSEIYLNSWCSCPKDTSLAAQSNVFTVTSHHTKRIQPLSVKCLGALDGVHIPVSVESVLAYSNQNIFLSQNILAVCNFNMKITYLQVGLERTAHKARGLKDAQGRFFHSFGALLHCQCWLWACLGNLLGSLTIQRQAVMVVTRNKQK
ncbi:uncharacterized protein VP01_203g8 [Puccinia sorghi]|uniref:DDE Tnp4 domain-containing protein n=1 Tax=Puccinia sorghi TaxID=27349 RepID=A0A0L6VCT1_9BASI|nr:uncharacterized protein VP01_203g8 [Puccinia sorghi]